MTTVLTDGGTTSGNISYVPSFDGMGITRVETIMPDIETLEVGQSIVPETRYVEISVNCTTCGKTHTVSKAVQQFAPTPVGWAMVRVSNTRFVKRIFVCDACAKVIVWGRKKNRT